MSVSILDYYCETAAGQGVQALWQGLISGTDHRKLHNYSDWKINNIENFKFCKIQSREQKFQHELNESLNRSWNKILSNILPPRKKLIEGNLGIIFSSTKGCMEDFIWENNDLSNDFLSPVLQQFILDNNLLPKRSLCVSNACASFHGSLFLANHWIEKQIVDFVLIISGDFIGPFIANGFHSLQALSTTSAKPFHPLRDGLSLGDGVGAILVSANSIAKEWNNKNPTVQSVHIESENSAVTRPSDQGEGLHNCFKKIDLIPDCIIAHGTGTFQNDLIEEKVFAKISKNVPITCTKWSIGHTMGCSGLIDTISAIEILKNDYIFPIGNTSEIDPTFHCNYIINQPLKRKVYNVLVSSLGFGGTNGMATIGWNE